MSTHRQNKKKFKTQTDTVLKNNLKICERRNVMFYFFRFRWFTHSWMFTKCASVLYCVLLWQIAAWSNVGHWVHSCVRLCVFVCACVCVVCFVSVCSHQNWKPSHLVWTCLEKRTALNYFCFSTITSVVGLIHIYATCFLTVRTMQELSWFCSDRLICFDPIISLKGRSGDVLHSQAHKQLSELLLNLILLHN